MLLSVAAFGCGVFAAYIDFHNDEPQAPMLVILVSTFLTGALAPKFAWLSAATITGTFALAHAVGPRIGIEPLYPMEGGPWWSLFVLVIPAAISAYLGVGVRRLLPFRSTR